VVRRLVHLLRLVRVARRHRLLYPRQCLQGMPNSTVLVADWSSAHQARGSAAGATRGSRRRPAQIAVALQAPALGNPLPTDPELLCIPWRLRWPPLGWVKGIYVRLPGCTACEVLRGYKLLARGRESLWRARRFTREGASVTGYEPGSGQDEAERATSTAEPRR
jgi:hypothetical protein